MSDRRVDDRPWATLSIDLDDRWAYRRAAGHEDWESSESYFDVTIPSIVRMLGDLGLPLTVFLVGRDLRCDRAIERIRNFRELPEVEFANHSWNHLPWMHTLTADQITAEIQQTHQSIERSLGVRPIGFRGPGFSCPDEVLRVLVDADYRYDASLFPTSMAPIARTVFLMRSKLRGAERKRAKKLYGGFRSMRQPNRPHRRAIDAEAIWELPVTTMPGLRTPMHMSYLVFLASKNSWLAKRYVRTALAACQRTGNPPSMLLHPPDFIERDHASGLEHLPGISWSPEAKLSFVRWVLNEIRKDFEVLTLADGVRRLTAAESISSSVTANPLEAIRST